MSEHVLILYLRTGGGHISAARALKEALERRHGVTVHLFNPIGRRQHFARFLIEKGYSRSSTGLRSTWPFVYEATRFKPVMDVILVLYGLVFIRDVRRYIRRNHITRVVSVHFLNGWMISGIRRELWYQRVLHKARRRLPACTVCTDPFTAHPLWFRRRRFPIVVFSERLWHEAVHRHKVHPSKVVHFPIILRPQFQSRLTPQRTAELKAEFGFTPDKRLVLLAGGGEGLANGDILVRELARSSVDFDIAIVCGHSEDLYHRCVDVSREFPNRTIFVYGFTDRMYELMNMSDVVVGKAGPATVMEVLLLEKPLIITSYMYGQERGNVDFVQQNRLGFFVQRPEAVRNRVEHILGDTENLRILRSNIRAVRIENGTEQIADYVLSL